MDTSRERRQDPRFDVRIAAMADVLPDTEPTETASARPSPDRAVIRGGGRSNWVAVVVRNVSRQGAFIATDRPPPLRSRVRLSFELEPGTPLLLSGLVVWRRTELGAGGTAGKPGPLEPGFGVLFDGPNDEIQNFIESNTRGRTP